MDEKRISNVFFSRVENNKEAIEKHREVLKDRPWLKEFWAAGNDGAEGYSKLLQIEDVIGVGAAEVLRSSKMCIRDRPCALPDKTVRSSPLVRRYRLPADWCS